MRGLVHALQAGAQDLRPRREQVQSFLPQWSLAPVVEALQALDGIAVTVAVGVIAMVGDMRRFDNPRQLMAYLGLVPGEHSSGHKHRPVSIGRPLQSASIKSSLFVARGTYCLGSMFWFSLKKFVGSYLVLSSTNRV
jgi:transposase